MNINTITKFHENYNRLNILDHVILFLIYENGMVGRKSLYNAVFMSYRQTRSSELNISTSKLHKLGLIQNDLYNTGWRLTAQGVNEVNFVTKFVEDLKDEIL